MSATRLRTMRAFIAGMASLFDWAGSLVRLPDWHDHPEPDAEAIRRDWEAVGFDMRCAIDEVTE